MYRDTVTAYSQSLELVPLNGSATRTQSDFDYQVILYCKLL